MKKGHTPIRMCMICRQKFAKKDVTRYVFPREVDTYGGALAVDMTQTKQGRGYYICSSLECQQKFTQKSSVRRKRKGV